MVTILFELTAETFDDENSLIGGWVNSHLSPVGMEQARQIGERHSGKLQPDAIFHSDLKAAQQTGSVGFSLSPQVLYVDWRVRECNYGDLSSSAADELQPQLAQYVTTPFPNGESYNQFLTRLYNCMAEIKANWDGKVVLVIGGPDIKYGLDYLLKRVPMEQSLAQPVEWQAGWNYELA